MLESLNSKRKHTARVRAITAILESLLCSSICKHLHSVSTVSQITRFETQLSLSFLSNDRQFPCIRNQSRNQFYQQELIKTGSSKCCARKVPLVPVSIGKQIIRPDPSTPEHQWALKQHLNISQCVMQRQ